MAEREKRSNIPCSDHRLDMRFLKSCAATGALVLISCGSPAELDEETFPTFEETGYSQTGAGGSTQTVIPGGGAAGSGSPVANAGSTSTVGGAGAPPVGGAGAGGEVMPGGDCPSDITVLFSRPAAQGGCTSGGGCHEATSPIKPDLVSPGVETRLVNMPSSCQTTLSGASVAPRPYISATDSFLGEKIGMEQPGCGFPMPLLMEAALSAADRQCIMNWIAQVAAGG